MSEIKQWKPGDHAVYNHPYAEYGIKRPPEPCIVESLGGEAQAKIRLVNQRNRAFRWVKLKHLEPTEALAETYRS